MKHPAHETNSTLTSLPGPASPSSPFPSSLCTRLHGSAPSYTDNCARTRKPRPRGTRESLCEPDVAPAGLSSASHRYTVALLRSIHGFLPMFEAREVVVP